MKHSVTSYQSAMEGHWTQHAAPLLALDHQCDHGKEGENIDHGKHDPYILKTNVTAKLNPVKSDAEAEDLTEEVKDGSNLGDCALQHYRRAL